jgi:predicted nucleotidyltransferase
MDIKKDINSCEAIKAQGSLVDFSVTSEQLAIYRETAQKNWQNSKIEREKRREKAWQLVHLATNLLQEKFGVTKVMVFGSLIHKNCFNLWSDVDIAVWGLSPSDTFNAMGKVRELDENLELNLVDVGACQPELLEKILQEGREI